MVAWRWRFAISWIESAACGGVAQLGERCVRNAEVGSSILLLSTKTPKPGLAPGFFVSEVTGDLRQDLPPPAFPKKKHPTVPFFLI